MATLEKLCPEKWAWPAGIPLDEWGRRGWRWLHITAINYAHYPSVGEAQVVYRRIWNFVRGLPCDDCCQHGLNYLVQHPPDLANSDTLQRWMHEFHNSVNTRLKKPTISFEEYRGLYADEICWAFSGGSCPAGLALNPAAAHDSGLNWAAGLYQYTGRGPRADHKGALLAQQEAANKRTRPKASAVSRWARSSKA